MSRATRPNPLIYADYVASGRALSSLKDRDRKDVLPYYSNAAYRSVFPAAGHMNRLRRQARRVVAAGVCADAGSCGYLCRGRCHAGLTKLAACLESMHAARGRNPLVPDWDPTSIIPHLAMAGCPGQRS